MTVATDAPSEDIFAGSGGADALQIQWRFIDGDDLVVTEVVAGVELDPPLVRGIDYAVTGGGTGGGTVIPAAPIAALTSWRVRRRTPKGQPASLPTGRFNPPQIEQALDRQALGIQEIDHEVARAIKMPLGEQLLALPLAALRAGKVFGFDNLGRFIAVPGMRPDTRMIDDGVRTAPIDPDCECEGGDVEEVDDGAWDATFTAIVDEGIWE